MTGPLTHHHQPVNPPAVQALVAATTAAEKACREAVWKYATDLILALHGWGEAA